MAQPAPLPVWDRQAGKLTEEWMDDSKATYETRPRRSFKQWLESEPLYETGGSPPCSTPHTARKRSSHSYGSTTST